MPELVLKNHENSLPKARAFVSDYLAKQPVAKDRSFDILLALNEAVGNAIRHGSSGGPLRISCDVQGASLHLQIEDSGRGFDYRPAMAELPDPMAASGRGFFLMHELMDEVVVRTSRRGTCVSMKARIHSGALQNR